MTQTYYAWFFAAMYLSEGWYDMYARTGSIHARTRALVLFDRVMAGEIGVKP